MNFFWSAIKIGKGKEKVLLFFPGIGVLELDHPDWATAPEIHWDSSFEKVLEELPLEFRDATLRSLKTMAKAPLAFPTHWRYPDGKTIENPNRPEGGTGDGSGGGASKAAPARSRKKGTRRKGNQDIGSKADDLENG